MVDYFIYRDGMVPKTPDVYMAQFREQLYKSAVAEDRAKLAIACPNPEAFVKICKMPAGVATAISNFAKKQKVPWNVVIMAFGTDLHSKAHFVVGYNFPRYIKAFLKRVDIPIFDLAVPENLDKMKETLFCETPLELVKKIVYGKPHKYHSETIVYDKKKEDFVFKDELISQE